jgi:uncharacterized heparinase superfamily protein
MLEYMRAYLRPDASAPLVGDADNSRWLPLAPRAADDHAYLVAVGAVVFHEPRFKIAAATPYELLWLSGAQGVLDYESLPPTDAPASTEFPHAGAFVLRDGDLYLHLNASGAGLRGRGSHAHNDALSVELSACGSNFIVDPGTYVYTADLRARQLFRSTAYHSTVETDGAEQNETNERAPFRIGDDARPRKLFWEAHAERDVVVAQHHGYERLPQPITHTRAATLHRGARFFLVEDIFAGAGAHEFRFRFHAGRAVAARVRDEGAELYDERSGARLLIFAQGIEATPTIETNWTSRDYGERVSSQSLCWTVRVHATLKVAWTLIPVCAHDDEAARLKLIRDVRCQMLDASLV